MMATKNKKRRVEYCAPTQETICEYASVVCENMAERVDPAFGSPEIASGLAEFLRIVAVMQAKALNKGELVDNGDE